MTRNLSLAAGASALLLATLQPLPVLAQEMDTMTVRISDLKLGSGPDAHRALRRIHLAAADFCGDDRSFRLPTQYAEISRCKAQMVQLAVSKLDAPRVTALYLRSEPHATVLLAHR